jgi:hypothetical protein
VSRRAAALVVATALVVVALAATLAWRHRRSAVAPEATKAVPAAAVAAPREAWSATLWLPSASNQLSPLAASVESAGDARSRAEAVIAALLAATPEAPRAPVFPHPVQLGRLLLLDGTAYVDLRPDDGGEPPSSGSAVELMRVYSIVHTLVRNVPEVQRVVLLWNGVQRPAFPGHVDTGHALTPLASLEGS